MPAPEPEIEIVAGLSLSELCVFCRMGRDTVTTLVEHGALTPRGQAEAAWAFDAAAVARAVKAKRLEADLGLNPSGIALVLDLLDERASLKRQLAKYEVLSGGQNAVG